MTNEQSITSPEETPQQGGRVDPVVSDPVSASWRVRFKRVDGMYSFTEIKKKSSGVALSEVTEWAEAMLRAHPDELAAVDDIMAMG